MVGKMVVVISIDFVSWNICSVYVLMYNGWYNDNLDSKFYI